MSQHLSSNFVEDYRQRRLSPAELVATDIHLAECDTCREMIADALQLPTRTLGLQADLTSNHASYEQLAAFTDGSDKKLDWSEREFLVAHFEDCAACSADLRDLRLYAASLAPHYPLGNRTDPSLLPSTIIHGTLSKGTRLGGYELRSLIGSGGMGQLYRAHDLKLDRDVAVKVWSTFLSSDRDRLQRFEQEARAAAALNHPNILAVFQIGIYEGAPYLVSELLEGLTLREHLRRGPLPMRKAVDWATQIADGLAAAHRKGILHRDLKPENLFVTNEGRIKIVDFGLAKVTQPKTGSVSADRTETEMILGTVGYMAPEQVRGEAADVRADIFAFGTVLYEMLSGKRAFEGSTAVDTMKATLNDEPRALSQLVPTIPPALERISNRCLEKHPEQRFQSASDVAFALESLSTPAKVSTRVSKTAWVSAFVLLLACALVYLTNYLTFSKPPTSPSIGDTASQPQIRAVDPASFDLSFLSPDFQGLVVGAIRDQRITTPFITQLGKGGPRSYLSFKAPPEKQLAEALADEAKLLSPVSTVIFSSTPTFKWEVFPDARGYVVEVFDDTWKPVIKSPLLITTSWKSTISLKRGRTYNWLLTTVPNGKGSRFHTFQVLDESRHRELEALKHDHPEKHFVLGVLYSHFGVLEDAEAEFRRVRSAASDSRPPEDLEKLLAEKFLSDLQQRRSPDWHLSDPPR